MKEIGVKLTSSSSANQQLLKFAAKIRKAQRKVEKKHFRDRMALLHHEKERTKIQREMGQDPYLDTAE